MIRFVKEKPEIFGKVIYFQELMSSEDNKQIMLEKLLDELVLNKLILKKTEELKIRLCIDEVLTNAITHGNNLDPNKKFRSKLFRDENRWGLEVQDDGPGFNFDDLPDYQDETFLSTSSRGRGLLILKGIIDEIYYCGRGNTVVLVNKIKFQK